MRNTSRELVYKNIHYGKKNLTEFFITYCLSNTLKISGCCVIRYLQSKMFWKEYKKSYEYLIYGK